MYRLDFRNMTVTEMSDEEIREARDEALGRVSPNRQGWRARLAHVEMLLADAQDGFSGGEVSLATIGASKALSEALAEVRAMIDETPGGET